MLFSSIDLFVTTKCTLRCKECLMGVPYIKDTKHTPLVNIKQDIFDFFGICESGWKTNDPLFKEMSVCSGEALLHPSLVEIFEELFKYRNFYSEFRLSTNCTLLPGKQLIEFAKHSANEGIPFIFMLNDYGKLSIKLGKIIELLDSEGIQYLLHKYWGDDQYCGGWLDLSPPSDKNSTEIAYKNFSKCRFSTMMNGCPAIHEGLFFPCSISCKHYLSGKSISELSNGDILKLSDYRSQARKLEAYKFITTDYRSRDKPFQVCHFCNGYDPELGPRIPAAEQIN